MVLTTLNLRRSIAALLLLCLSACAHVSGPRALAPTDADTRAQLSIGYTLLYQEADGIPKLKWILMFKDKSADMSQITSGLIGYYQQLAATLMKLSKQYPAMRLDVTSMSQIEGDERKAIGGDLAKDMAPLIGKSGLDFEREALLNFYDALNEQRHLVGVMLGMETSPGLKQFLESTKGELDARYAKVGALLNRRYFTH